MPLVRIDVVEGRRTPEQLRLLPTRSRRPCSTCSPHRRRSAAGRFGAQKGALHAEPARRLEETTGLAPRDLIVSVVGNTHEDSSSGLGRARFLQVDA